MKLIQPNADDIERIALATSMLRLQTDAYMHDNVFLADMYGASANRMVLESMLAELAKIKGRE